MERMCGSDVVFQHGEIILPTDSGIKRSGIGSENAREYSKNDIPACKIASFVAQLEPESGKSEGLSIYVETTFQRIMRATILTINGCSSSLKNIARDLLQGVESGMKFGSSSYLFDVRNILNIFVAL